MAGLTDASFRQQCRSLGAGLAFTELTPAEGVVRKGSSLLDVLPGEKPGIQLFGSDPDVMARAAKIVAPFASVIDVNLGCPSPSITSQQAGAALLTEPTLLKQLFSSLTSAVDIPVTAKMRLGPSPNRLVYRDVAHMLQAAGASMITLHARTASQGYSGKADWPRIKELVDDLDIPVCGNGDVTTPEEAKRMLDETGCRYVMIGRAAMGNPFLFRQCEDYLAKGRYEEVSEEQRKQSFVAYANDASSRGVKLSRIKHMAMLATRGLADAKEVRVRIARARVIDDLTALFS